MAFKISWGDGNEQQNRQPVNGEEDHSPFTQPQQPIHAAPLPSRKTRAGWGLGIAVVILAVVLLSSALSKHAAPTPAEKTAAAVGVRPAGAPLRTPLKSNPPSGNDIATLSQSYNDLAKALKDATDQRKAALSGGVDPNAPQPKPGDTDPVYLQENKNRLQALGGDAGTNPEAAQRENEERQERKQREEERLKALRAMPFYPAANGRNDGGGMSAGTNSGAGEPAAPGQSTANTSQRPDITKLLQTVIAANGGNRPAASPTPQPTPQSEPEPPAPPENNSVTAPTREPLDFDPKRSTVYWIRGGTLLEAVLDNSLDGEEVGPVKAITDRDLYFPYTQSIAIPKGSTILGEAKSVGNQSDERIAIVLHRIITPGRYGYGIPLTPTPGLSESGEAGLHDKVNRHYASIFGASLAIGAIGGIAQLGNSGSYLDIGSSMRSGVSQSMAQSSNRILEHFLQRRQSIQIRKGKRMTVLLLNDLPVPLPPQEQRPGIQDIPAVPRNADSANAADIPQRRRYR